MAEKKKQPDNKKDQNVPVDIRRRSLLDFPELGFGGLFSNLADELFYRFPGTVKWAQQPKVNVKESAKEFTLQAEIPGYNEKDINVELDNDTITISGEQSEEKEEKQENWLRREHHYGSFSRTFTMPVAIDSGKAKAKYKKGILEVTLPKKKSSATKKIDIETS